MRLVLLLVLLHASAEFALLAKELPPVLGDAHVGAALPAQATFDLSALLPSPEAIAHYLAFFLFSALIAGLNQALRKQKGKGRRSGPVVLFLLSVLNGAAGNLDQTARQVKAAKTKEPQS